MNSYSTLHCSILPLIIALLYLTLVGSAVNAATVLEEIPIPTSTTADALPVAVVDDDLVPESGLDGDAQQPSLRFQPCNLNEPTTNECIKGLFDQIVPLLRNEGLPDYKMVAIDPYNYRRGIFRYTNDGVQGGLLIKNMEINGLSDLKVNSVVSNFTQNGAFIIKLGIEIPKLKAGGHFKADVKFGGLRLVPRGPFNITIDNIKLTTLTDGVIEEKENGKRLKLQRLNANVEVGTAKIVANGIFSDRNLNTMMLNLVNENLPQIVRIGIPSTRDQWAPILVTHVNDFFADVPIEKLLV